MDTGQRRQTLDRFGQGRIASRAGPVRAISRKASNSARVSALARPWTVSAIRSAEAMLMAQPRASKPTWPMRVGVELDPDLNAVAAHRVVALGGGVEIFQPHGMARTAAMIQDDFLVQVAQIVETVVSLGHAKNSRTRGSPSASASISAWVV